MTTARRPRLQAQQGEAINEGSALFPTRANAAEKAVELLDRGVWSELCRRGRRDAFQTSLTDIAGELRELQMIAEEPQPVRVVSPQRLEAVGPAAQDGHADVDCHLDRCRAALADLVIRKDRKIDRRNRRREIGVGEIADEEHPFGQLALFHLLHKGIEIGVRAARGDIGRVMLAEDGSGSGASLCWKDLALFAGART